MKTQPKVSVLVPVYNVETYLRECLNSLIAQTLHDIEIIAINDGSTDSSPSILREYAARDSRIRIIDKPNSGYGDSMNRGLAEARGTYVGIVESDDYIDPDMYRAYVAAAEAHDADMVKSNYYEHKGRRDYPLDLYRGLNVPYDQPVDPHDFPALVTVRPCLWAALYRRDFLQENGIDFAPTPGASFQDTSFYFATWFAARTVVVLQKPYLHYRIDSAGSSKTSQDKVFSGNEEFARALGYLKSRGQNSLNTFAPVLGDMWFGCLVWHFNRMGEEHRRAFVERWSGEIRELFQNGWIDLSLLMPESLNDLHLLMADSDAFCVKHADGLGWPGFTYEHTDYVPLVDQTRLTVRAEAPEQPAVSVIMPIYNVEAYVRESVESLLAQTFTDFEVLCVNDGSTDNSRAIAKSAIRGDARFRWIDQDNAGVSAARNSAVQQAKGTRLLFVDSDDTLVPHALQTLVEVAVRNDLDYLDFTAYNFYESAGVERDACQERYMARHEIPGVMTGRELFVKYQNLDEFFCPVWLHFFKRSLIGDDLRFAEGLIHEDELYSLLLIERAQRAAYLNEQLYTRRMREGSLITAERGIRNVDNLTKVVTLLEGWLNSHVRESAPQDDAFYAAFADRISFLKGILATDAELTGSAALDEYEATLTGNDLVQFRLHVRGGLAIRTAALATARDTRDYRIGKTLLAAPRALLNRLKR